MTKLIGTVTCNLMSNIIHSKRLPILHLMVGKNTAVVSFHGRRWPLRQSGITITHQARRDFSIYCSFKPGASLPPTGDSPSSWKQWVVGIVVTVIIPFFSSRWTNLLKFKDEVDTVVEEAEKIIDCVEEVAETVDKVAKDVADHLPEGGKWRNVAVFVEDVAEEIDKEAHLAQDFLHEVEEVEHKVELLVDSIKDQAKNVNEDPK